MNFLRLAALIFHLLMHIFREVIPNLVTFMIIPVAVVLRSVGEPMNSRRGIAIRLLCQNRTPIGERRADEHGNGESDRPNHNNSNTNNTHNQRDVCDVVIPNGEHEESSAINTEAEMTAESGTANQQLLGESATTALPPPTKTTNQSINSLPHSPFGGVEESAAADSANDTKVPPENNHSSRPTVQPICPLTCFGFRFSKDPALHPSLRYSTEDYPHDLPLYDGHTHTILAALIRKERSHQEMRYFREKVRSNHDQCTLCLDWCYATHIDRVAVDYGVMKYYEDVDPPTAAETKSQDDSSRLRRRDDFGDSCGVSDSPDVYLLEMGDRTCSSGAEGGDEERSATRGTRRSSPKRTASEARKSRATSFRASATTPLVGASEATPHGEGEIKNAKAVGIDRWDPETHEFARGEVIPIRSWTREEHKGVPHADLRACRHVDVGYGYNVLWEAVCEKDIMGMAASVSSSAKVSPTGASQRRGDRNRRAHLGGPSQGYGSISDSHRPFGGTSESFAEEDDERETDLPAVFGVDFDDTEASREPEVIDMQSPNARAPDVFPQETRDPFSNHIKGGSPTAPRPPTPQDAKAVIAIVPGLGSSSTSNYIQGWVRNATREGFHCVVAVARGLGDTPLDKPQPMCAAFTGDLHTIFGHHLTPEALAIRFGKPLPLILVGFSVGGAMSIKYLSEARASTSIHAAIAINSPWDFHDTANSFTRKVQFAVYGPDLAGGLGEYIYRHKDVMSAHPDPNIAFSMEKVMGGLAKGKTFGGIHSYDSTINCPIYGCTTIEEIYNKASALQYIHKVEVPLLCFTCEDDPVTGPPPHAKRWEEVCKHSPNVLLVSCPAGGHMGYLMDPWSEWMERPNYMEYRLLRAIRQALRYRYTKRTRDVPKMLDDPPFFRYDGKHSYLNIPVDDWLMKLRINSNESSAASASPVASPK